ncbi:GrpB family protein [Kribbella sp. NPDC051952]|uniref:GrpB family protein n=1 Tax=Kribbella sp. NPDC051952 TaxID=3154851 RepID=UPI0034315F1A
MTGIVIARPDESWPAQYEKTAHAVGGLLGELAQRIDHIGSTSVPGLPAKDIIDMQVTVGTEPELDDVVERMVAADWESRPAKRDHVVPGLPADDPQWVKRLVVEPMYRRKVNLHIRVAGRANQRYALLFRDYLRSHPDTAKAYGTFKRQAAMFKLDVGDYTDLKDPVCDLIYLPAEEWAASTGWTP